MAIRRWLAMVVLLALSGASGCGAFCPHWCREHQGQCCGAPVAPAPVCYQPTGVYPQAPVAGPRQMQCTCNVP